MTKTWTNKMGLIVEIKPVPTFLHGVIKQKHEKNAPKPPQRTYKIVGGDVGHEDYNDATIKNATDEEKKLYQEFKEAQNYLGAAVLTEFVEQTLLLGVVGGPSDEFYQEAEILKEIDPDYQLPDDHKALRRFWMFNYVARSSTEQDGLFTAIQELSRIDEALLESINTFFRIADQQKRYVLEQIANQNGGAMERTDSRDRIKSNGNLGVAVTG